MRIGMAGWKCPRSGGCLELHPPRHCPVDDQVRAADEAGARARQEHDRVGDLLRRTHSAPPVRFPHPPVLLRLLTPPPAPAPPATLNPATTHVSGASTLPSH